MALNADLGLKSRNVQEFDQVETFPFKFDMLMAETCSFALTKNQKKTNFIHQQNDKGKLETTKVSKVVFLFFLHDSGTSAVGRHH